MALVPSTPGGGQGHPRGQFLVASTAVLLSAADTYVVVLILPAMMTTFGVSLTQLQRATPIVSGYLLGYIVALPLIGRLSDRVGRRALFFFAFLTFGAGSIITASSATLAQAVVGRAVQGIGGGALLPLTFALSADRWGPQARSVPIGAVGAVQELGSLLGPVYGAVIVTLSSWQEVFWLNCPLIGLAFAAMVLPGGAGVPKASRARAGVLAGLALAGAVGLVVWPPSVSSSGFSLVPLGLLALVGEAVIATSKLRWPAKVAGSLVCLAVSCVLLQAVSPASLVVSPSFAPAFLSVAGLSPLEWSGLALALGGLALGGAVLALLGPAAGSRGRTLDILRRVDYPGVFLAGGVLTTVVLAFSTSDPARAAWPHAMTWVVLAVVAALGAFVLVERRIPEPLVPFAAFANANAWGSLLASVGLGVALIVVLVDVPLFARATTQPGSQLGAALVLVRFLVGVPLGALVGGVLTRRLGYRWPAAAGAALAAAMLAVMSTWGPGALASQLFGLSFAHASDPVLVLCGVGMGATIAPLTTSLLNCTPDDLHGLAASLVVVARMVGMVVGVSLLTTVGLHTLSTRAAALPSPAELCPGTPLSCPRYDRLFTDALTSELTVIFFSAALACGFSLLVVLATQKSAKPAAQLEVTATGPRPEGRAGR